jgi:hypothetical protein
MWWIFGLINVVIVGVLSWFYCSEVKEEGELTRRDKIAIGTLVVFAFLGGIVAFVLFVGLLVYLFIDFIKFIRNKHRE